MDFPVRSGPDVRGEATVVGARAFFAERLDELITASELPPALIARSMNRRSRELGSFDQKRISDWRLGRNLPKSVDVVELLVGVVREHPKRKAFPPDATEGLLAENLWRKWWRSARAERPVPTPSPRFPTVRELEPRVLGVHQAAAPDGDPPPPSVLTPYLRRSHDAQLRSDLGVAVAGGPSVFAVLIGDSTTGKTRALYEALHDLVADWPVLRPRDAAELVELVSNGAFRSGTVLWLNETQSFLDSEAGEKASRCLDRALWAVNGAIAVGAMWRKPHFEALVVRGRTPDGNASARELLEGPRTSRISVPPTMEPRQLAELAVLAEGDPRLRAALSAGRSRGRVIQQLTGGPKLLDEYSHGGKFAPVEYALITAALDARRLGFRRPLPGALLAMAADGYLHPYERPGDPDWAETALAELVSGVRADGSRTDVLNTLCALTVYRERSGVSETAYVVDDYLDQYARQAVSPEQYPAELWNALAEHTDDPDDLYRLGNAAKRAGRRSAASLLWRGAAAEGHGGAGVELLKTYAGADDAVLHETADWIARTINLDNPNHLVSLLREMRQVGAIAPAETLVGRDLAAQVTLSSVLSASMLADELRGLGLFAAASVIAARLDQMKVANLSDLRTRVENLWRAGKTEIAVMVADDYFRQTIEDEFSWTEVGLLKLLYRVGANYSVSMLIPRIVSIVLDDPYWVAEVIKTLFEIGAWGELAALLERDPASHVFLENSFGVYSFIRALRAVGAAESLEIVLRRAPAKKFEQLPTLSGLVRLFGELGADDAVSTSVKRLENADYTNPIELKDALNALHSCGAHDAIRSICEQVAQVELSSASGVAFLIATLRRLRLDGALASLMARSPAGRVALRDPFDVACLVGEFHELGATDALDVLIRRDPMSKVTLEPFGLAQLMRNLHTANRCEAVSLLANRAFRIPLGNPGQVAAVGTTLHLFGETAALTALLERRPVEHVALDNGDSVAQFMLFLHDVGELTELDMLLARDPASLTSTSSVFNLASLMRVAHNMNNSDLLDQVAWRCVRADFKDALGLSFVVAMLREVGRVDVIAELLARDPVTKISITNPFAVRNLIMELRKVNADKAVRDLMKRDPASRVLLGEWKLIGWLLETFEEIGAHEAADRLLARVPERALAEVTGSSAP
ncbi:hypothetical protein AB5J62_40345 [Amycolatopsis sp. cg5]|uniref:hypothetical protein n=1 Tax=Amycolatopsis sp. cg5 TaxID=3238802 RepID=UPI0035240B93